MKQSLILIQTKHWILKNFPVGTNPNDEHNKYTDERYLEVLNIISASIPFTKPQQNYSLSLFLYSGCLHFGRWFPPSPYFVSVELNQRFKLFVNALVKAEGIYRNNSQVFELHSIRNDLYGLVDEQSFSKVSTEDLNVFATKINEIELPQSPNKQEEFLREKLELIEIINSIKNKSLKTVFRTWVPYVIDTSSCFINYLWKDINVSIIITPELAQPEEPFINASHSTRTQSVSRWQHGTSEILMKFDALIDGDILTENLQLIKENDIPTSVWAKCFNITFSIFYEVSWQLRAKFGERNFWIPAPQDIGDIETMMQTSILDQIKWKRKFSGANMKQVFVPSTQVKEIGLNEIINIPWSAKCKYLSTMYLDLGETNESLFWLNVAVESLFRERFKEIAIQENRPELESELNSPKAFWGDAEEIVSKQFPELVGKIIWPDSEIHVSIYSKLKHLYRVIPMKTSVKELLKHYRVVSEHRNALFHGVSEKRISIAVVLSSISSYEWILENFRSALKP